MTTVNIQEAKTHLSRLLERAQAGERIVIAKAGVPIAELTAVRRRDIVFGAWEGKVSIDDDAFAAADAEVAAMWDADLEVEA
jgi:prevent-host-death family protein